MNLSSFGAARFQKAAKADTHIEQKTSDADALAQLARFIYAEMNIEPRQMHVAIQLAREQLLAIRELLVSKGLRRPAVGA